MNIPNLISLSRLLSVPLNVWLIILAEWRYAFFLFCLAGISDALDGMIAKRFNAQTRLGQYLDPIADKVLLVSIFVVLGAQGEVPLWLVILVVSRDLLLVGGVLFLYLLDQFHEPRPLWTSKVNTAAQILTAALVLVRLAFEVPIGDEWLFLSFIVAGVTTAVSGAAYLVQWGRLMSDLEPPRP